MANIKLRNVNPVVFNYNVGLGDTSPSEKLVINNGAIKMDHANGGQGIFFQSQSSNGNNCSLRWANSSGTERFRLIVDPDSDKTDRLQINSNNNNTNCLTISQAGYVGLGTADAALDCPFKVKSADNQVADFHSTDTDAYIKIQDSNDSLYVGSDNGIGSFGGTTGAHENNLSIGLVNGNVGVGVVIPLAKFHTRIAEDINFALTEGTDAVRIGAANDELNTDTGLEFKASGYEFLDGNAKFNGNLEIEQDGVVSHDMLSFISSADNVDEYSGIKWILGGGGDGPHGAIRLYNGPSANDAYMTLSTTTDGANLTQGIVLDHLNRVGINTTSTVPVGKLEVFSLGGIDPIINARGDMDGGRIRLSHGVKTNNYGEIGMRDHTNGSEIWIGANLNSHAITGHSNPTHADNSLSTWYSVWDCNSDKHAIVRIANGDTTSKEHFTIDTNGITLSETASTVMRAGKDSELILAGGKDSGTVDGANIVMYGSEHASKADTIELRQGTTIVFSIAGNGRLHIPIGQLPTSNDSLIQGDLYRSGNTVLVHV